MERRRFLGLAAAAGATGATAVGAFTAAGCGTGTGTQSAALTVVAADYGDPGRGNGSQAYWNSLVNAFQRKHSGIAVDVQVLSWKDVDRKVAAMVAAGRPPDIAQIGAYADFAAQGRLYSAREVLSIPVQADFLPPLAGAGEVRRVQYGMPFVASTRLLFYNKTLFARAGLDPDAPPRTWEQLARAAARLKAAGVKIPYGLPLGPEEAPAETLLWLLSGGGSYTDKVGNYTIDAAANIKTFDWLRDRLVRRKLTNRDPGGTDRQELFDAFVRGEVGMLNGHPTLLEEVRRRGVKYGTAVVPGAEGPSDGTLGVADWVMAFRQNGRREEAGRFLDFLFSEKNHYAFADRYDLLPVTTSANERMRGHAEHKPLRRFQDELVSAEFYPVGKVSWAKVSADLKKSIGKAVGEGPGPAGVLGAIQRRAEARDSEAEVP
ncbi:ABC transporter substrate-binding protein [Streptomyces abyssalis]|uniref:ABC transporter substrate-binding protein n=1 Tax=Streptomyces abyssalis TaxID=933944 RepID=A0A1E7JQV5_9ACTN|nr:extracellular solute-binding protein [Streptomyces abyssalis]OEU87478.1 ABC transporter substrate-binding protein [Streptomyces abyssalis]OEU90667.1 ABC transporter substrate-binding protein [Streptomyces abyssalis]OEV32076.1 ABC transporter substrate-binding protein [Streptomyces nanshensis]